MNRGSPAVEQPGLGQKERANADGSQTTYLATLRSQPRRQRSIAKSTRPQAAYQKNRIARTGNLVEVFLRDEGEDAAFTFDRETFSVRHHLDLVDRPAGQSVHRIEHL